MLRVALLTVLFLLVSIADQGFAMRVKLLTLEQMVERAEVVFVGRCLTSTSMEDPQLERMVTVIEFEVVEALKGGIGDTHTVRQYGGTVDGKSHRIAGMPTYAPGEDVILFLYGESEYGLTSPVGASQGKFSMVRDDGPSSSPMIVNSINNNGLLTGLGGHMFMDPDAFAEPKRNAIRSLVRANRGSIPYEEFLLITKALISRDGKAAE